MSIVSSTFVLDGQAQRDGRTYCREQHTDNIGRVHVREYLSAVGADNAAILAAFAITLATILQLREQQNNLNQSSIAQWTFDYNTVAQMGTALRAAYLIATGIRAAQLAIFVTQATNLQIQNAFGVTSAQATNIQARAQTIVDRYNATLAVVGE